MTISIDGLYVLINTTSGQPYPRLLIDKSEADKLATELGNHKVYGHMFI